MRVRYFICDVFTETRFGGNPLAVVPDATGIPTGAMQQIAREFNFSETTFVLPPEAGQTRRVRIFTPTTEIPFAGHPNIGTAYVLAAAGEFGALGGSTDVVFEERAGHVPVSISAVDGAPVRCELAAPEALSLGAEVDIGAVAAALSLEPADIATSTHAPRSASVGMPFLVCEVAGREALGRARIDLAALERLGADSPRDLHVYTRSDDAYDLRARMFAPLDGVPEDPATGSASCALAGLLAHCDARRSGTFAWRIAQGVEMGRPSTLDASARKVDGEVVATGVAGATVLVSEGWLELD